VLSLQRLQLSTSFARADTFTTIVIFILCEISFMRIITCLLILLFISLLSTAQLRKGQWMVGGTADFAHTVNDYTGTGFDQHLKQTGYNFFPEAGYFFMNRFVAGLRVNVSDSKTKDERSGINPLYTFESFGETTVSGIGIGAFVRYYLLKPKNKFNAFAEAAYSHSSEKSKAIMRQTSQYSGGFPTYSESRAEAKYNINYYSLMVGPVLLISPKVSFELSLGYTLGKVTKQDQTIDRIAVGTGFQVYLGK
jgi:hypothetical protein